MSAVFKKILKKRKRHRSEEYQKETHWTPNELFRLFRN